jgi:hypothetical protein
MRLILLLLVVVAIGLAATRALKSSVPVVPPPNTATPAGPATAPASREALRQFGDDVNRLTREGAAERARQTEEATR